MAEKTEFSKKVIAVIKKIPKGKVATYGQIAGLAGKPHAPRGVTWVLHSSSKSQKLPWHRVINSKGKISFPPMSAAFAKQKRLLTLEKIEVGDNGEIDLEEFQWSKKAKKKMGFR